MVVAFPADDYYLSVVTMLKKTPWFAFILLICKIVSLAMIIGLLAFSSSVIAPVPDTPLTLKGKSAILVSDVVSTFLYKPDAVLITIFPHLHNWIEPQL